MPVEGATRKCDICISPMSILDTVEGGRYSFGERGTCEISAVMGTASANSTNEGARERRGGCSGIRKGAGVDTGDSEESGTVEVVVVLVVELVGVADAPFNESTGSGGVFVWSKMAESSGFGEAGTRCKSNDGVGGLRLPTGRRSKGEG